MKIMMHCGFGFPGAKYKEENENYIYEEYLIPFANEHLEMWYEKM